MCGGALCCVEVPSEQVGPYQAWGNVVNAKIFYQNWARRLLGTAQSAIAPRSGRGGRRFSSPHPDQEHPYSVGVRFFFQNGE